MATRIALVGIGKIARDQHVPSIAASPDWELAATVSSHSGVEGVPNFASIGQLLAARPDIGVVSLCMPPAARYEIAAAAIEAGRHVMLEKPPGATISECHMLAAQAKKRGVTLYSTWHSREAAAVASAKAWLAGKTIASAEIIWKEDVRRWHPGQAWIWKAGGLGVFDPGINALSILTEIMPAPVRLVSAELDFPANCETPIGARLQMVADAAPIAAEFDWRQEGDQTWTIEVRTDKGVLAIAEGGARMSVDGSETAIASGPDALHGEYPRLYARMAELVRTGFSDADFSPMALVADAFLLGRRHAVDPFVE